MLLLNIARLEESFLLSWSSQFASGDITSSTTNDTGWSWGSVNLELRNQLVSLSLGEKNLPVQMALLDGGTILWDRWWVQEKSRSEDDGWLIQENIWEKRIGSAFAPEGERPLDLP